MTFRQLRERRGFPTQSALAEACGLEQTQISHIELGKTRDPRYSTLEKLAKPLRTTTDDLMRAIRRTLTEAA